MASLADKSAKELCDLMDEYGIKHGPVVDSTRDLYEKKLKVAMANEKRPAPTRPAPTRPAPERTYYRDEFSGSTKSQYEKKPNQVIKEDTSMSPSDKTYYREEEDVSYVYRTPVRDEDPGESMAYMRSRPEWSEREYDHARTPYSSYPRSRLDYGGRSSEDEPQMYDSPSTYRSPYLQSTPRRSGQDTPKAESSSHLVPMWVQVVVFLVLVVFLYFVFLNMESNQALNEIEHN